MLDQMLATLDVRIRAFGLCEACPGWRLSFGPDESASVHYVLSGSGSIHVPDMAPIPIASETLTVLPKGLPHAFDNGGGRGQEFRYVPSGDPTGPVAIRAGNPVEGQPCLIVACGAIEASFAGSLGLFDFLQYPLAESFGGNPLGERFKALLDELRNPSLGTQALTEAFLKQTVVLTLRRHLQKQHDTPSWLEAFRDPVLTAAVQAIFQRPGSPFTTSDLASMAGVSRSVFHRRFVVAFGQSPMEFLKNVRLQRAARLLEVTALPVKVIAKSVGYGSRSHFSRAFREAFGIDPTEHRTRRRMSQ